MATVSIYAPTLTVMTEPADFEIFVQGGCVAHRKIRDVVMLK